MKKIISLLVAMLLVMGTVTAFAFEDTDGTKYEKAVDILQQFKVINGYEDKTFRPEGELSRAEFAAIVVRILGENNFEAGKEQIFTDVNKKHWAFETVAKAKQTGYFAGLGDGTFAPDEKITYAQAVKVMVSMLGYQQYAEAMGGFPAGYMQIAAQKNLLKGVAGRGDEPMNRGSVALLIYNCLDAPTLVQSVFGDEKEEFKEDASKTLLTEKFGCDKYEGIVYATDITSISGAKVAPKGKVNVGGLTFKAEKSGIEAYIGYEVELYAKEDEKTEELSVVLFETSSKNKVIEVAADDIDPQTNLGQFIYWEDGKDKAERVNVSNAQAIINAKAEPFYTSADLKPTSGTVTLIDNNGDDNIDVVLIKEYKHYVVDKIDSEYLIIYDKYDKEPINLTAEGKSVEYKILRKGSNAKINNIVIGSVLSVLKSRDGEYIEINIITDPVRGEVTAIENGDTYLIGDKYYERSADLPDSEEINIKDSGTFYLDIEGRIIYVLSTTPSEGRYFYLLGAAIEGNTEKGLKIRVLDVDGKVKVFDIARRATFEGQPKTHTEIYNILGGGTTEKQPLRYALNAEGQVTELYVPSLDYPSASRRTKNASRIFGYNGTSTFFLAEESPAIFQVPEVPGADEEYKVLTLSAFSNRGYYNIAAYDVVDYVSPLAIVTVADANAAAFEVSNGISSIITSIKTVLNGEEFPVKKIEYYLDGKEGEVTLTEDTRIILVDQATSTQADISPDDLQVGDIIQIRVDTLGIPTAIGKINLETDALFSLGRGLSGERCFGKIVRVAGNYILLRTVNKDGETVEYVYTMHKPSGAIYAYERGKEKLPRIISAADVVGMDTVEEANAPYAYVSCTDGAVNDVFLIYEEPVAEE